jgi:hypothetical protein
MDTTLVVIPAAEKFGAESSFEPLVCFDADAGLSLWAVAWPGLPRVVSSAIERVTVMVSAAERSIGSLHT